MNKTSDDISCLYLIDIKQPDEGKTVYKLGYTKHMRTRFSEHMRKYGNNIQLSRFVFIPDSSLSHAETLLKKISINHKYEREGEKELIALDNQSLESVLATYDTISQLFCGNLREVVAQYDAKLKDKDVEILVANHETEMIRKDNEILQMKILLLEEKLKASSL